MYVKLSGFLPCSFHPFPVIVPIVELARSELLAIPTKSVSVARRSHDGSDATDFFLDRLMCFGSFWIFWIMVSKWFKPKRKNINIFRWLEKFWWCWTSLGLWFQDVGSILTYLLVGLCVEMVTPVNPIGLVGDPTSPSHWLSEKSCCVRSRPIYRNIHEDR